MQVRIRVEQRVTYASFHYTTREYAFCGRGCEREDVACKEAVGKEGGCQEEVIEGSYKGAYEGTCKGDCQEAEKVTIQESMFNLFF